MPQHPAMRAAEERAAAVESALVAELAIHRFACVAVVLIFGALSTGFGLLLALGGEERLQTAFFRGPSAVVPGWPWTFAGFVVAAGLALVVGQVMQSWWVGIGGAIGVAAWSFAFTALSWVSIALPGGELVAWYPTALYGGIGALAVLVGWWLNRLRVTQHHAG